MVKQIGIWIDLKEAFVVELGAGEPRVKHIPSEVEDFHVHGGARSRQPYGPMDKTSDTKYLGRRQKQLKQYFQSLMKEVADADELFVFGPAEAKAGLEKAIRASKAFKPNLKSVETADNMTKNQMVARVRDFFTR